MEYGLFGIHFCLLGVERIVFSWEGTIDAKVLQYLEIYVEGVWKKTAG